MASDKRLRLGIIGMGGYAARHHEVALALEDRGECRLVCTCDPRPESFAEQARRWRLEARRVAVHTDYLSMLDRHAGELDVVVIATPIPLHAEMHAAVVGRGLAAYLEKPPTLDPDELEEMIARDARAPTTTLVGFNFIAEAERQALKRRLVAGEFGVLREARLFGFWGRSSAYYGRSAWAGRLFTDDGRLLLDSCLGNGLSHHVHNLLHWAGVDGLDNWATPTRVRAWLARAHPIEGADTCFAEAETDSRVLMRIAISHACSGPELHRETLICDHAEIEYVTNQ
ncbi:MAG: Gfo/Idh/MocA family oxidoreductase, partial [Burkholderiales bacterium]|nr:Gfo/Idh/MocA family oxidoreductase [Opitutaceae bacterium]